MARENYVSLYTDNQTNEIFTRFLEAKGVSKATALGDMMRLYMLANDPELYMDLLKKTLHLDRVRDQILEKDQDQAVNDLIFIKLGGTYMAKCGSMSAVDVMGAYQRKIDACGSTWFSTVALSTGMNQKKVKYYNEKISQGEAVRILFAIGDEIRFSANIRQIVSNRTDTYCPGDTNLIPSEFGPDEHGRIWFLLDELKEENNFRTRDLRFSSGGNVFEVITSSQCAFGYVRPEE